MRVGEKARAAARGGRAAWWGDYQLVPEQTVRWRIGPLELWVHHRQGEWRVVRRREGEGDYDTSRWSVKNEATLPPEEDPAFAVVRYVFRAADGRLRVEPRVADRPVVVSPRIAVFVPPGEEVVLYVSSPVWVRLAVGSPPAPLHEVPATRLSDTWFGSVLAGEAAYALPTRARLRQSEMPPRPHRAVTPLRIRNLGREALAIDRVKLEVPLLSLYVAADGALWTEEAVVEHGGEPGGERGLGRLDIRKGPPAPAPDAALLTGPRRRPEPERRGPFIDLLDWV